MPQATILVSVQCFDASHPSFRYCFLLLLLLFRCVLFTETHLVLSPHYHFTTYLDTSSSATYDKISLASAATAADLVNLHHPIYFIMVHFIDNCYRTFDSANSFLSLLMACQSRIHMESTHSSAINDSTCVRSVINLYHFYTREELFLGFTVSAMR